MERSLVVAIGRAYVDPRSAMARQITSGLSEPRSLFHLFLACGLAFLASLPNAVRAAQALEIEDPLTGAVAAHLFGYLFVAPLLLYALAALVHLAACGFGGRGGFLAARAAVFWAAVLGAPIAMLLALAGVAGEVLAGARALPVLSLLGYAGLAYWLWLLAASLAEAEGFAATSRVAAALLGGFAGIAVALMLVVRGVGSAG